MASHTRYYIFVYHDNAYVSGTIYFFFYKLYDREVLPLHPPPPPFFLSRVGSVKASGMDIIWITGYLIRNIIG